MHARIFVFFPRLAAVIAAALTLSWLLAAAPLGALPAAAECTGGPARTARDPAGQGPTGDPTSLTLLALSKDAHVAHDACDRLRAQGPPGLAALYEAYPDLLAKGASDPHWPALAAALDRVSGQKDDFASRLYWYTDFEQARAAARQSGRTILSLRIPGRLDADPGVTGPTARLFRTALYADSDVARILASRYVLHWASGALPPAVSIELGDGQTIQQPVAGSSAHYVLDADGHVIDVLPGVEDPAAFRSELLTESQLERSLRGLSASERAARLVRYHALRRAVRVGDWPAILG